ncbi:casein kinase II beta subunit [Cyclospora cayetanensis]|uniref:Casein kinase II subunit beta n=1 Tax=Cyclospora cayetanensis TaxID=88456 RepID=A0A1D3D988_9EIME|nr:casein kinase II beta subunit [Cyclospora cayetanensis]
MSSADSKLFATGDATPAGEAAVAREGEGEEGHDCFAEVDEEYIRDTFNLFGLKSAVNNFDSAMDMILGEAPDEDEVVEQSFVDVYRDAVDLYGLIHARYIISPRGLPQMLFCPLCREVYEMLNGNEVTKDIDGAYFGPSFPHIFLQTFSSWVPNAAPIPYQPRLFGFKIHNRHSVIKIKLENGEYGSAYVSQKRRSAVAAIEGGSAEEDKQAA